MKILVCGNHNPYFFNTVECREKALRELGHDVLFFDARNYRLPWLLRKHVPWCQKWDVARNSLELVEFVRKEEPETCLVIGGDVSAEAIRNISSEGILTALWTTEPPHRFQGVMQSAPEYDRVFCGGTEALDILDAKVKLRAAPVWLPFASDPELHRPVELTSAERLRYSREVVFVGSYYPNRAAVLEPLSEFELGIWGPSWNRVGKNSRLFPFINDRRVGHEEWRKIYSVAQMVAVVHFQDGITPCSQASPILFEALACGAFVLCDEQRDARTLFKDGEHLVFFKDPEDLFEKVRYYLDKADLRSRIAAAGRNLVLEKHSWRARMQQFLSEIVVA